MLFIFLYYSRSFYMKVSTSGRRRQRKESVKLPPLEIKSYSSLAFPLAFFFLTCRRFPIKTLNTWIWWKQGRKFFFHCFRLFPFCFTTGGRYQQSFWEKKFFGGLDIYGDFLNELFLKRLMKGDKRRQKNLWKYCQFLATFRDIPTQNFLRSLQKV